ncbi:hypothetical protein CYY_001143 [Polysphondylium violaceum]|uniref:Uncharacterized protein n=1 Tax=Polysphondylium violaceum TaxID=133409 RepID=A0A8J4Q1I0_9MYCE|nr:hypothetical protein CYY_001143 [Polysphondylium violaceum]
MRAIKKGVSMSVFIYLVFLLYIVSSHCKLALAEEDLDIGYPPLPPKSRSPPSIFKSKRTVVESSEPDDKIAYIIDKQWALFLELQETSDPFSSSSSNDNNAGDENNGNNNDSNCTDTSTTSGQPPPPPNLPPPQQAPTQSPYRAWEEYKEFKIVFGPITCYDSIYTETFTNTLFSNLNNNNNNNNNTNGGNKTLPSLPTNSTVSFPNITSSPNNTLTVIHVTVPPNNSTNTTITNTTNITNLTNLTNLTTNSTTNSTINSTTNSTTNSNHNRKNGTFDNDGKKKKPNNMPAFISTSGTQLPFTTGGNNPLGNQTTSGGTGSSTGTGSTNSTTSGNQTNVTGSVPSVPLVTALPNQNSTNNSTDNSTGNNTHDYDCLKDNSCFPFVPIPSKPPLFTPGYVEGWEPLRIQFDYSFMNNGSCLYFNQSIFFGRKTDIRCNSTVVNNCVYYCKDEDVISVSLVNFIRVSVMPTMAEVFESMLQVRSGAGGITKLNQKVFDATYGMCGNHVAIDKKYLDGLDNFSNLLIYITLTPMSRSDSIAFGLPCSYEFSKKITGRPLAGVINLNPKHYKWLLNISKGNGPYAQFAFQKCIRSAMHEMIHILGFLPSLFPTYLDPNGIPHTKPFYTKVVNSANPDGVSVSRNATMLNTPRINWVIKNHYGCSHPQGIELESRGGSGVQGSHFSEVIANGELMTARFNSLMSMSIITLASLQDMGWYIVDTSFSQEFQWGRGEGCSFIHDRCEARNETRGYFCGFANNVTNHRPQGCSPDRKSFNECTVKNYLSIIPPLFQRFKNRPTHGGPEEEDFCPSFYRRSLSRSGTVCSQTIDSQANPDGDHKCFMFHNSNYTLLNQTLFNNNNNSRNISLGYLNPACFVQRCQDNGLLVLVDEHYYHCPWEGGLIWINNTFSISCPAYDFACQHLSLPLLIPRGLELEDEFPERPIYKKVSFWVPMSIAIVLSMIFIVIAVVYKRRNTTYMKTQDSGKGIEMGSFLSKIKNPFHQNNTTPQQQTISPIYSQPQLPTTPTPTSTTSLISSIPPTPTMAILSSSPQPLNVSTTNSITPLSSSNSAESSV